ncbi:hypothetical protein THAOC_28781 [Thalassiosira oceanica]|uniref:Uncharacterized protein n=1 Tax=Thalassiosira oceanica TaxID=159749 RepID=K0RE33_THAOC|nr:hypothetical protein THAOC_28781 [Thalassiosira oceanica]|eukprot:EJK51993.1 hypothetical protein THAOC_28781 [Thalassiosira oceanica]
MTYLEEDTYLLELNLANLEESSGDTVHTSLPNIYWPILSPGSFLAPGTGNPSVAPYGVRLEEREAGGFIDNSTKHIMCLKTRSIENSQGAGQPSDHGAFAQSYGVRLEEREAGGFIDNTKHIMFEDEIESSQGAGQPSDHGAFAQSTALASSVRPLRTLFTPRAAESSYNML